MKGRQWWAWMLILGGAVSIGACGKGKPEPQPVRPAIVTRPVPLDALAIESYSGDVRARQQSALGFRIGGKIAARLVDAGSQVKKGQVLATLAPEDARLNQSAAAAAVASARADLNLAEAELERHRQLLDKNFISRTLYETRVNQQKAAKARLDQAQAEFDVASNQSAYTQLRADADGVITTVSAEVGQVVAAGTPVLTLAHAGELEVDINVPESRYADFAKGRPLIIELWSGSDQRYAGTVREVSPEADAATRTYPVRVAFDQPDRRVQLGMTARVFFTDSNAPAAVLVPMSALYEKDGKAALWVVAMPSHQVSLREVRVGQYREDGITITAGVDADEWIVAAGVHKLTAGQTILPVDRENRAVTP
ncbi:MAG: efflux RND transporter periplasmic adaptor subunit [Lysobacterales bacterium]